MKRILIFISLLFVLALQFAPLEAQRFPKPEFESGHSQPAVQKPEARSTTMEYVDVFVLFAALAVASWLVIRRRSRKGVLLLAVFSLVYFGFIREGCICSVGSVQNVTLALFNPAYSIPITAILFFTLPLLFTLFFGRTFCAGVCPLGAIQELVAIKPIEIKPWLQKTLGVLPFIYLGLAILYAATASDFVICRYDPFIGIYRLDGTFMMFVLGALLLLAGIFIARPYCRFLCPYGVLLNWVSRFSKYHMTITPTHCIDCKLCEHSCPYGAIEKPVSQKVKIRKKPMIRQYILLAIIIPVLIGLGGWSGYLAKDQLALVNPKVRLAKELVESEGLPDSELSVNVESFRESGKSLESLIQETEIIIGQFKTGGILLGIFLGLVIGSTLLSLSRFKFRDIYEPNRATCLSCARCMDFCPVGTEKEHEILLEQKRIDS